MKQETLNEAVLNRLMEYAYRGRVVQFIKKENDDLITWMISKPDGGFFSFQAWHDEELLKKLDLMDEHVEKEIRST